MVAPNGQLLGVKRLLGDILRPLATSTTTVQLELYDYISDLIDLALTSNSQIDEFLDRFAETLLSEPGANVTTLVGQIEQISATAGQRLSETDLPLGDKLKIGRNLSHQLMLLRMKLAQHNIRKQKTTKKD